MFIGAGNGFTFDILLLVTKVFCECDRRSRFLQTGVYSERNRNLLLTFFIGIDVMEKKLTDQIFIQTLIGIKFRKFGFAVHNRQYNVTGDVSILAILPDLLRMFISFNQNIILRRIRRSSRLDYYLNIRIFLIIVIDPLLNKGIRKSNACNSYDFLIFFGTTVAPGEEGAEFLFMAADNSCWLQATDDPKTNKTRYKAKIDFMFILNFGGWITH